MAFHPIDRDTDYLLPPSVQEWLPQAHLARYVVDVIEGLDLSTLERAYAGRGSDAYHPATLLGLLIYGYATGCFSSRKIERATYDSLAFRFIAKARIEARAKERFEQEQAAYEAKRAARSAKAAETGKKPGGRMPKAPEPGPRAEDQINLTDEESRIMKVAGGGFEQCYNAQAVVDTETMLVLAPHVTNAGNDKEQVAPMVEKVQNVATCVEAGIAPLMAVGREGHHPAWQERFTETAPLAANASPVDTMKHMLKTPAGRQTYALRKQTVEPVFGIVKSVMGFRQFLLRGLENVRNEWTLVCLSVWPYCVHCS